MSARIETITGVLAGVLGVVTASSIFFVGPASLSGTGSEIGPSFVVLVGLGLLLALGIAVGAYLHSQLGYGSFLLWLCLILLAMYAFADFVGFAYLPVVILGVVAAIASLRRRGPNFS